VVELENVGRETLESMITQHPFWRDLAQPHLAHIVACTLVIQFEPNEHILIEGHPAENFYLIQEGEVALKTFLSPSEGFVEIQRLKKGDILGWSWLVPPHYWHFSAFAIGPTVTLRLDGKRLRHLCEADHEFGYEIQKRLLLLIGQRLRRTRQQLLDG
jgi:CRP-like cAMP-binding protein